MKSQLSAVNITGQFQPVSRFCRLYFMCCVALISTNRRHLGKLKLPFSLVSGPTGESGIQVFIF